MGKLALSLLMLVSATANALGYNPTDTGNQPITGLFGIILGVFAVMVASAMSGYLAKLQTSEKKKDQEFGGGGASGHW